MAWFLSLLFFFLISSVTACDRCVYQSKASHYYDDRPTSCKDFTLYSFFILFLLFNQNIFVQFLVIIIMGWGFNLPSLCHIYKI